MNFENDDMYYPDDSEMTHELDNTQMEELKSFNPTIIAYGANRVSEIPEVQEKIEDFKEAFSDKISDTKEAISDFFTTIGENIKEFTNGVYEGVKEFFEGSKEAEDKEFESYPREFSETREFGLDHCVEAAKEYFNPGVIENWANLSANDRAAISYAYAAEVAKAFQLENYKGVIFEEMAPGTLGSNCGDGYIHLTVDYLNPENTPLGIVDTITHELRHQYQMECIAGYHDVPDEVRNEWAVAKAIYTTDGACSYDPWGYMYNPLETDSRFAGETVVREMTKDMINDIIAQA